MHLKHALYLEDEEKFEEAKDEFIQAGKPREAIDMFVHQQDWNSATRVAQSYEPAALPDVLVAQARSAVSGKKCSFTFGRATWTPVVGRLGKSYSEESLGRCTWKM